jgi:flagellar assembly protein FliH
MSRVISGEEFEACQPWQAPRFAAAAEVADAQPDPQPPTAGSLLTAEAMEEIQRQAYEEGFAQGRQEGHAAGLDELRMQARRLEALMTTLAEPFEALDQQVEQELVALAVAMARHLVRRELKTDPGQIVATVREAMRVLPAGARQIRLHLHPEDAQLLRNGLSLPDDERVWRIVEDPLLTRGGCRVVTEDSQIDASVETRMNAVIAAVLGGEREVDQAR